jgi:hypothetical protein
MLMRRRGEKRRAPLSLDEYREILANLTPPTPEQVRNFALYVASAHSWYKHLRMRPPGTPVQVYLDPDAGMECGYTLLGRYRTRPRLERGFHYSWIPTTEYREKHGHLAFSCRAGKSVGMFDDGLFVSSGNPSASIYAPERKRHAPLPDEVSAAGRAHMTAAIHTRIARVQVAEGGMRLDHAFEHWHEDSGGPAAGEQILAYCREKLESFGFEIEDVHGFQLTPVDENGELSATGDYHSQDPELLELFRPERERQLRGLARACERVCALVGKVHRRTD